MRLENPVENGQTQSNNDADPLSDPIQIVKDEKSLQNCKLLAGAQFGLQDLKGNLMDVRTADGSIVKIQTNMQEQELVKTLGVEMVQNMYKVNVDDLNQLLAYHEIFGKLQGGQGKSSMSWHWKNTQYFSRGEAVDSRSSELYPRLDNPDLFLFFVLSVYH